MKIIKPETEDPKKKKMGFGAVGVSVILHLALFLLIGGVVVVEYAVPRSTMTGEVAPTFSEETPETMPEPEPDTPSEAVEPAPAPFSPDLTASSIDVLAVNSPVNNFQMPAAMGIGETGTMPITSVSGAGEKSGKREKSGNPFGGSERLGNASMRGFLYDLKKTKDGAPSGITVPMYGDILKEFFKTWNRKILDDFYRVKDPLYTTQIYMPLMNAGAAPTAFHVEKEVLPSEWVVIYEGAFQVPETGQFRFAGYADDILVVRVNGKTLLNGSRSSIMAKDSLVRVAGQEVEERHVIGNGITAYSAWQNFRAGDPYSIEILVGEQPGSKFCAYLFIEQKNSTYQKEASGRPILPLFRTADMETAPSPEALFQKDGPILGAK